MDPAPLPGHPASSPRQTPSVLWEVDMPVVSGSWSAPYLGRSAAAARGREEGRWSRHPSAMMNSGCGSDVGPVRMPVA